MSAQETIALGIVAATVAVFAWSRFRRRQFNFRRDTACGCGSPRAGDSAPSVTLRAKKGGPSEVVVKLP
jgi:hypothetical protein